MIELLLVMAQINLIDEQGNFYQFRFDGVPEHNSTIGWIRYPSKMIFIMPNKDMELTKKICNHEVYHYHSDKPNTIKDHLIIGQYAATLPSWVRYPVCDKLIKRLNA